MGLIESITGAQGPLTKDAQGNTVDATGRVVMTAADQATSAAENQKADATNSQVAAAQSEAGGLTQQGFTWASNPDGTLTITGRTDGKPLPGTNDGGLNGAILSANGQFMKPDGTPFLSAGGQPVWNPRTPAGLPATANPNFKGDGVLTNGNNTGLLDTVPGFDAAKDAASKLLNGLKDAAGPGAPIDTSGADTETNRANALADALGGQAGTAGTQADVDRGLGGQTRAQQEDSITGLAAAANGTAPSAAELQLKQQSGIDAARQYGLAAALQGNNPGAALRQASLGAAQIAGATNQNAAINRANEQATARGQLASTLANVRQGDQGAVNTDVNQQGTLTQGQLTSQGQGVTSTGQKLTAQTEKEKADAARAGALIGAGGTAAATLLSDKRAKKDIAKADLADALGKEVHGVTFTYVKGHEDEDHHAGALADELERAVPGVVKVGPDGMKVVHTGHLALASAGILAELARRLQRVEKSR